MPYLDYLLSNILSNAEMSQVKRINVYVQNNTNSSDLTVRTLPGSNDFIIPSLAIVANRFNALQPGMFIISNQYSDQYSKSNNSTLLMGLRSTMPAVGN